MCRLNDVLEFAEDICIDIPQLWDYLGQVLAPVMAHSTLSLSLLSEVPANLVSVYMCMCMCESLQYCVCVYTKGLYVCVCACVHTECTKGGCLCVHTGGGVWPVDW